MTSICQGLASGGTYSACRFISITTMRFNFVNLLLTTTALIVSALCFAAVIWTTNELRTGLQLQRQTAAVMSETASLCPPYSSRKKLADKITQLQLQGKTTLVLAAFANAHAVTELLSTQEDAERLTRALAEAHDRVGAECNRYIFISQCIVVCWLTMLLCTAFVGWIIWHRMVDRPFRNIGCLLTIAQDDATQQNLLDLQSPADVENALKAFLKHADKNGPNAFLAEMSHEIKTPLNGLIGFISNLNDTPLNDQQKQYLKIISSSANSLLHVINQVLDYSKINAGALELENVAFDLHELAQDRIAITSQIAKNKSIRTYLLFPGDTPLIVRGDPNRLRQILDNLLSNAVKFTNNGEICLDIQVTPPQDGMQSVTFAVRDTGCGIPPKAISSLFKPFQQADTSITRQFGGTGLGLCISNSLVKLMGGTLDVRSRLQEGTTFSFTLAMKQAQPEEQIHLPGPFIIKLPRQELKKYRGLLVDDTPTNLFLLETVCQNAGLPYRTAVNGQEAVELCTRQKYDVIFMDIQMPVMDGYTAIGKIRQLPNSAMTHIIALTASAFQEDIDRALNAGATEYLPKPFEKNQLLLCIADVLAIRPEKIFLPQDEKPESPEEKTVRLMHDFMQAQYQLALGEIKMTLAQTVADWRPLLDNLRAYTKSANYEQAAAILHRLKGQLASIGLPEQAEAAAILNESMLEHHADVNLYAQVDELIQNLTRIFKVLEQNVSDVKELQ